MSTILNDQLKAELEQVRDRLLNDQDSIIQATITQTEAELDRVLQQINSLLEGTAPSELAESTSPVNVPQAAKPPSSASKPSSALPPFNAAALKSQFKNSKPMDAILQVVSGEREPLSIDDLIGLLYEPFDSNDISKARKSVAITTKHAERRGLVRKVQENPARFQAPGGR